MLSTLKVLLQITEGNKLRYKDFNIKLTHLNKKRLNIFQKHILKQWEIESGGTNNTPAKQ